jgi:hypothetical protein
MKNLMILVSVIFFLLVLPNIKYENYESALSAYFVSMGVMLILYPLMIIIKPIFIFFAYGFKDTINYLFFN